MPLEIGARVAVRDKGTFGSWLRSYEATVLSTRTDPETNCDIYRIVLSNGNLPLEIELCICAELTPLSPRPPDA